MASKRCWRNVISAQCSECQMKKFNQARVNGGSNYDSLKCQMPRHLISDAHEWINEIPLSLSTI